MEFIGMLVGLFVLSCLCAFAGLVIAACCWLLFWGKQRPKKLILGIALVPSLSVVYFVVCAIVFAIVVPNQPDLFFGDISEPVPHGYVLSGLGKMPEFSYFDSEVRGVNQPQMFSGIESLEQSGEMIYGAYSHPDFGDPKAFAPSDIGYFAFDTRSGQVRNFKTMPELNATAGHSVHLVKSQYFRSQLPGRIWLRRVENVILFLPPLVAFLLLISRLIYVRVKGFTEGEAMRGLPEGGLGLSR